MPRLLSRDKIIQMNKYETIENDIKEDISNNVLKNGDRLPSEIDLCKKYDVSRITVRKALDQLALEGLIVRLPGNGSYVQKMKFINHSGKMQSFTKDMLSNGLTPGSKVLSFKICKANDNEFIRKTMKMRRSDLYYECVRLRTGNDVNIALNYTYLPYKLFPDLKEDTLNNSSLYEYIEKMNYDFNYDHPLSKTIAAVMPSSYQKRILKIGNEPLLKVCTVSGLTNGEVCEYSETYYISSRFVYSREY